MDRICPCFSPFSSFFWIKRKLKNQSTIKIFPMISLGEKKFVFAKDICKHEDLRKRQLFAKCPNSFGRWQMSMITIQLWTSGNKESRAILITMSHSMTGHCLENSFNFFFQLFLTDGWNSQARVGELEWLTHPPFRLHSNPRMITAQILHSGAKELEIPAPEFWLYDSISQRNLVLGTSVSWCVKTASH